MEATITPELETAVPPPTRKIRIADALPEIVADLPPEERSLAQRYLIATLHEADRGIWRPRREIQPAPGHLGLLVLEGLLSRDVVVGETLASELVGRGDVLRPSDHDGDEAPVPFDVVWHVLEPARIAVLDREFARLALNWPEVMEVLFRGAVGRARSLAISMAVSNLRRVDTRLLVTMWYLADRWGRVTPEGVHVPLRLTHQTLGRVIGAQRPSVSTALKRLAANGQLTRAGDGTWMLHGDPPDTLERLRTEKTASREHWVGTG